MIPSYTDFVGKIINTGVPTKVRGLETFELINETVRVGPGEIIPRVGFNHRLALAESMMLVAGQFDKGVIKAASKSADLQLFTGQSAYGPRVFEQMPMVIAALKKDPSSRRAVVFIGRPTEAGSDELPCTETIQFLQRDNRLVAIVNMRSSDAVYGLPYDLFQFGFLTILVARCLGAIPTDLFMNLASAHVYQKTAHLAIVEPHTIASFFLWADIPAEWPKTVEWAAKLVSQFFTGNFFVPQVEFNKFDTRWD